MNPFVVGILINSALYLTGAFVAGLVTHNAPAWKLALVAAGVTYLSHMAHSLPTAPLSVRYALLSGSISLGALAGIVLL